MSFYIRHNNRVKQEAVPDTYASYLKTENTKFQKYIVVKERKSNWPKCTHLIIDSKYFYK